MAAKQTKSKAQAKTRARGKKVKISDLQAPKGGGVKGGATSLSSQIKIAYK